ncbi:isocitrate dehydrogenase kinase/phosphatase-domain containing protein, partial [Pseudomonadota bacterium]
MGDKLVIKHVYIERRMEPLDQYLNQASASKRRRAIRDFGQSIRDMVGANIFPGDML